MDNVQSWVQIGTWCVSLSTSMPYNQCDCKQKPRFFHFALGSMLGQVVPGWACLPPIAHLGPMLGLCWPYVYVGLCWPYPGLCWPCLGPMLALCWPMLAPCWPILGPMLRLCAICETICWKTSKMQIFPSRTPRRTKNNVKTTGFYFREQKTCARPSAQNTVKHDVFVTSHTGNTVNYGGRFPCLLHALSFVLSVSVMAPKSCKEVPKTRDAAYLRTAKGAGERLMASYCVTLLSWPVENFSEGSRHGSKEPQRSVENPGCCLPWNYH